VSIELKVFSLTIALIVIPVYGCGKGLPKKKGVFGETTDQVVSLDIFFAIA